MLIINKPAGLAVHGGSGVSSGVIESIRAARPLEKNLELSHRRDRDTSGCLMIAKRRSYLKLVQAELHRKNKLKKRYQVLVHGTWPKRKQRVDAPLAKNLLRSGERFSRIQEGGKESLTEYQLESHGQSLSALSATPVTGRTHQIRVHCQFAGFPVVGDPKYGDEGADKRIKATRLMLHAASLDIPSLDGHERVSVKAQMDDTMRSSWENVITNN